MHDLYGDKTYNPVENGNAMVVKLLPIMISDTYCIIIGNSNTPLYAFFGLLYIVMDDALVLLYDVNFSQLIAHINITLFLFLNT